MRRLVQAVVKTAAEAADRVRPRPHGVVVLIYHRVGAGTASDVDEPIELFDAQMAALAESGRAVTLERALQLLDGDPGGLPPGDPVVVTFDDGTADFVDHAVPVLARHGVPATMYVATDFVDRGRPFPGDAPPASWAGLAEAVASGVVDIGSHTHTHALLDRLDPGAVGDELDRSIDLIGERLGRTAHDFAYPKALAGSGAAEEQVRRRFRSAAVGGCRPNPFGATDPHRLARSPIQVSDRMRWFHRKAAGGMAFEDQLRRGLNRARYRGKST